MKNKIPPDNTGKKYLTELTPKQRKFIDVYCSKYGEITGTACAIAAGYSRDSAHTKASELLDYRKYPQVRTEIDLTRKLKKYFQLRLIILKARTVYLMSFIRKRMSLIRIRKFFQPVQEAVLS